MAQAPGGMNQAPPAAPAAAAVSLRRTALGDIPDATNNDAIDNGAQPAIDGWGIHPGLWLDRGLKTAADPEQKTGHLDTLCRQTSSSLYRLAFERWQRVTVNPGRFRSLCARLTTRLYLGSGRGNALETGVSLSHSYGVPLIPGSAVKGCVRAWAESRGLGRVYLAALFGADEPVTNGPEEYPAGAGGLVWHDAWWCPEKSPPLAREVITPHHQEYYSGRAPAAADFDSPVPSAQAAVRGGFYFVVEGEPTWAELGLGLLAEALPGQGLGGKRAAGYGLMKVIPNCNPFLAQAQQAQAQAQLAALPPWRRIWNEVLENRADRQMTAGVALFQALEARKWSPENTTTTPEERKTIAQEIADLLKSEGKWKPNSNNPDNDRNYQRTKKLREVYGAV